MVLQSQLVNWMLAVLRHAEDITNDLRETYFFVMLDEG